MVVGVTSMVVEASVSVDGAVVFETAFVTVEASVVLGEGYEVSCGGHLYGSGSFSFC